MRRIVSLLIPLLVAATVLSAVPALALVSSTPPAPVSPNKPDSAELVNHPKKWDGKSIRFAGEVITQAMVRGDYAWIHINDDSYYKKNVEEGQPLGGYNSGHAVWIPARLTAQITHYGDYRHEGDIVRVSGTFNAACAEHGGDMDIHATSLEVLTPGHDVTDPIKRWKPIAAIVLAALAGFLWVAYRRAEHLDMFGPMSSKRK